MDLELSPDQELLRETTCKFLQATVPLTEVRRLGDSEDGFERGWWRKGAELGWTSLLVDEQHGGGSISGEGLRDLALIAEEMGALVSPGPLIMTNVVAQTLASDGADGLAQQVLTGLLAGELVGTWCVAEPGRTVTADEMTLRAHRDGDEFVLDGVKGPVEAGGQADWLLVTAVATDGLSQFLVPASAPGLRVTPLHGLDLVRRFAELQFDGVRVPASALVGDLGGAAASFERQLQTVLVLQCAEIVGATDRVFEFTVQYAFDRSSFGRALASYQALKHRFADMKLWLESAHAITVDATKAVQAGDPDADEVSRIAKAYAAERCAELIQDCIQLHGGIGVTWEHNLHLYLRRVVVDRQSYGDPMHQRDRAAILTGR
jgi:alkylation response protein AidB-like acyl-CoA dehydrogenase